MSYKRSIREQGDSTFDDELDDTISDDYDTVGGSSKRSKRSKSTVKSVPFSQFTVDGEPADAQCILCRIGLFCDINIQAKSAPIIKIEGKIRDINHKFINVNNTNILMSDIKDLINDELKQASVSLYGQDFEDLSVKQVKRHFFDCIIEPVLQARKSYDFWNALFERGKDTVMKQGEDGDVYLDEKQINALAKIDSIRHASMYPRDPRESIFFVHGLSAVPKNIANAPQKGRNRGI